MGIACYNSSTKSGVSSIRTSCWTLRHESYESSCQIIFWWPGLDVDIENLARDCVGCKQTLNKASNAPLHPWEYPKVPWTRIHIDFAGPFMDHLFLVVVDATFKWPEITKTATAEWTVSALRSIFARFGVPCRIVSDNGSQFCSEEFSDFTKKNGIKHIFSAPYHPVQMELQNG